MTMLIDPRRHTASPLASRPAPQAPRPPRIPFGGAMILAAAGVGVLLQPGATPRAMRDVAAMLVGRANEIEQARNGRP